MEHFLTLFLSTDLCSDAHQSQIIGGDAGEDHTQIVGGYTVKLLGGYIPRLFRHHCPQHFVVKIFLPKCNDAEMGYPTTLLIDVISV